MSRITVALDTDSIPTQEELVLALRGLLEAGEALGFRPRRASALIVEDDRLLTVDVKPGQAARVYGRRA